MLLEVDPEHGSNWNLETRPQEPDGTDEAFLAEGLVLDDVTLRDVTLAYRGTAHTQTLTIDRLAASTDPAGVLAFEADGRLNDAGLRLEPPAVSTTRRCNSPARWPTSGP